MPLVISLIMLAIEALHLVGPRCKHPVLVIGGGPAIVDVQGTSISWPGLAIAGLRR